MGLPGLRLSSSLISHYRLRYLVRDSEVNKAYGLNGVVTDQAKGEDKEDGIF
jgi:hypothetical protein